MTSAGNGPDQRPARPGGGQARPKPTIAQLGIDLAGLHWRRSGSGTGSFEVAFAAAAGSRPPSAADAAWVLLRVAGDPAARVLLYDRVEWESFVHGAARGEFDDAVTPGSHAQDPSPLPACRGLAPP